MSDTMSMDLSRLRGRPAYDANGEPLGNVEEIFYDEETNVPEWVSVNGYLVPVRGAGGSEDSLRLAYTRDQIVATRPAADDTVSQEHEAELYDHYGFEYSERRSESGLPESGGSARMDEAEGASVTRSEEELAVGKQTVDAGRVRLRKWVETEPVALDVQLLRETARVSREPIDQPVSGAEIGEQEIEVGLRAEEAFVEKQAVAKERITLEKDVETENRTVSDEVRKERVEIEGDNDPSRS
jgi:uncharacterized protein (TIGR02271 family)